MEGRHINFLPKFNEFLTLNTYCNQIRTNPPNNLEKTGECHKPEKITPTELIAKMTATIAKPQTKQDIRCPACDADVHYRYGRTKSGKKRYLCLICNRQFVLNSSWRIIADRPDCPNCGQSMHVYMRNDNYIRFRCSRYPDCRSFVKMANRP